LNHIFGFIILSNLIEDFEALKISIYIKRNIYSSAL
jgi:hypothetical protein